MTWMRILGSRVAAMFTRNRLEHRLDEEVRFHIELLTEENIERGMGPDDARYAALRTFGGVDRTKEAYREQRGLHLIETIFQDLRYGVRQLRLSPGFAAVAVVTLALGIGANIAIFTVVYDVLLKPLPFSHPEQLVGVFEANEQAGVAENGSSYQEFEEWRRVNLSFSEMAGDQEHELTLTGRGEPVSVRVADVTPEIFPLLDARPLLGRTLLPEDGKRGAAPVALLSEGLWRSRFAADPAVIGIAIDLDKRAFTVVGVMPDAFQYPLMMKTRQLWIPLLQDPLFGPWTTLPGGHWLRVVARLKPGIPLVQAQAEMDAINRRLAGKYRAGDPGWAIRIGPLKSEVVGKAGTTLLTMLGAVVLVLLIACANVANLLLARATSRAREFAVRVALGAGRFRIVRQLLTESVLLGLVGAAVGVFLAYGGAKALGRMLPPGLPRVHDLRIDGWMLGFALLLSMGASLLFGLAPALFAADSRRQSTIQESGRSGEGLGRLRIRRGLVAVEIALALVLLVGAGLFIRSFAALITVDPGFDARRILKAEVSLPRFQYSKQEQWVAFSTEVLERVQAQPGMQQSAIAVPLPLADGFVNLGFSIEKGSPLPAGRIRTADYVAVSPGYFQVLGIPLVRGRYFERQDTLSTPRVVVISEALARLYFPDRDPIGSRLVFGFPPDGNLAREIVGIVRDVRDAALSRPPGPMMYVPFAQAPFWGGCLIVKTAAGTDTVARAIRQIVHEVDRDLPVDNIEWMSAAVEATVATTRFRTWLIGVFGAMALALATAGVFGVISYSVSCRTHEFGIRIALGATRREILRLVMREGLCLTLAGAVAGIAAALALTRLISSLLYGVRATDPATFVALPLLLTGTALLAAYLPARRATRVDPIVSLRHE